jgi:hypothetical protein
MEVKNSIMLNNVYKDAFSGQWHPHPDQRVDLPNHRHQHLWRAYFNVHDNYLSQPDPAHHP